MLNHRPHTRTCGRIAALLFAAAAAMAAVPAHGVSLLTGPHNGNTAGDGLDLGTMGTYLVAGPASFSGNSFNGLFDSAASLIVRSGHFDGNGNAGLQAITPSSQFLVIGGGSFDGNLVGAAIYGAPLLVNGGDFSANSAYGLETHSTTRINGGSFTGNGSIGVIAFAGTTSVYGGSFSGNVGVDFAASSGATVVVFGSFDQYGVLTGSGSFTGTLARGGSAQSFNYATFSGGTIVLEGLANVSTVPEPATALLMLVGGLWVLRLRRAHPPLPADR